MLWDYMAMEFNFILVVIYVLTTSLAIIQLRIKRARWEDNDDSIELFLMETALTDSSISDHFMIFDSIRINSQQERKMLPLNGFPNGVQESHLPL